MAKLQQISPARRKAFDILQGVEAGAFSSDLLAAEEPKLQKLDRALCHEMVMGVLRRQFTLDHLIAHYCGRKVGTLDIPVLVALRLGLYQLRYLSRVPVSAAVNESVNLVGAASLTSARGFVNAVLRRAAREPNYDPAATVSDSIERLAIETSHPRWLVERWIKALGVNEAESLARSNNDVPPTALRVIGVRGLETDVLEKLRKAGATLEPSKVAQGGWRISGATSTLRQLAEAGQIYLQDEASQLVARFVDPQPDERILDLCAAPGGKATHIADLTGDRAHVCACDISEGRLMTVANAVSVQHLRSIDLVQLNAELPLPFKRRLFDRVLVDAPCSGTGTLRRNPEIKWRITLDQIRSLSARQKQLLLNAAEAVKPGGRLVYSTCSVEVEENEEVVSDFLSRTQEFVQLKVESTIGTASDSFRSWPHRQGSDGFFVAIFQRR